MVHGAVGFLAYLKQGGAVAGVREGQLQILRLEMELFFRVEEIVQQAQDEFIIVALEQGAAGVFGLYDGLKVFQTVFRLLHGLCQGVSAQFQLD